MQHARGLDDLLGRLLAVDPSPVAVRPAVRSDRHARSDELADVVGAESTGLAEQAGEYEELGFEPAVHEPWKGNLQIGCIAIVKRDSDVVSFGDSVERLLELLDADPCFDFAWIQFAVGWSNAMHGDVHAS